MSGVLVLTQEGALPDPTDINLADDMLKGAKAIGEHIDEDKRRTFYLLERRLIPAFKIGALWHMRKSSYRRHIEQLEQAAMAPPEIPQPAAAQAPRHRRGHEMGDTRGGYHR